MELSTTAPIFSTTFHALSTEVSAVILQLSLGFLLAGLIGLLAWRWRALSVSRGAYAHEAGTQQARQANGQKHRGR